MSHILSDFKMGLMPARAGWKSITTRSGAQYVMTISSKPLGMLFAINLDMAMHRWSGLWISLSVEVEPSGWTTFNALEAKIPFPSANSTGGD
jgi:hypothetical protein